MIYTREFTDNEIKILENDLLDIKQWIDDAILGKINNCKKRIQKQIVENEDILELTKVHSDIVQAFLIKNGSRSERENGAA